MIIVLLQGGLGNQLFQYAFARAVSSRLKTTFKLDQFPFHTYYKLHKYSLDHFNIQENPAKNSDLFGFVWMRRQVVVFDFVFRRLMRKNDSFMPLYFFEKKFNFNTTVFTKDNIYFDGYWNTSKYFDSIGDELRNEISLKNPLTTYSQSIANDIAHTNAVSIHVRRADYISNKKVELTFGACSPKYYEEAIAYVVEKIKTPHFFIFSDDVAWAKNHFKSLSHPITCVDNTAERNYEDMTLMSLCRHNIIANSTFSWWGAWLNKNRDKIVIAPKNWFASKNINTSDVVPASWICM